MTLGSKVTMFVAGNPVELYMADLAAMELMERINSGWKSSEFAELRLTTPDVRLHVREMDEISLVSIEYLGECPDDECQEASWAALLSQIWTLSKASWPWRVTVRLSRRLALSR